MTPTRITILFLSILSLSLFDLPMLSARTWTAKSGHKAEGEFVKLDGDIVHILLTNGKAAKLKLNLLSESDQEFVQTQRATADGNPFDIGGNTSSKDKDAQSVTVMVEGIGSTFEDAKKDAFSNAVNEVVGTIVDAETRVTQEKVLEQVLTASNAYIEKHKILSQEEKGKLWHVTMEATVQRRSLQMCLGESPETVSTIDGASILGRLETKAASEDDTVLLLAKVLRDQNFPYSIMEASAEMVKEPVRKEGNDYVMQFNVTVKPNAQKFDEFRKAVEPVLEKIAISKRTLTLKVEKNNNTNAIYVVEPPRGEITQKNQTIFMHMNAARNNSLANTRWNSYELPQKAALVLACYSTLLPAAEITLYTPDGDIITSERVGCIRKALYNCIFGFDKADNFGRDLTPFVNMGSHSFLGQGFTKEFMETPNNQFEELSTNFLRRMTRHYYFAPFFCDNVRLINYRYYSGTFYPEYKGIATITLGPEELKSVKSIKCMIVSQNPSMDAYYEKLPEILKYWNPSYK